MPSLVVTHGYRVIPPGTGGSAFKDTDWPSPANRPAFSGSTLTWVGPLGGGANDGNPVQQTRTLTNSGGVATSANNQVIQGLNISGTISIAHNNVTIKQCRVFDPNDQGFSISITANVTGLVIEDCLIDGNKSSLCGFCPTNPFSLLATTKNVFRRNYLTGYENHITLSDAGGQNNIDITDNYFTACGNSGNASFDGDMIELYHVDTVLVQHNQFDGSNSQTSSVVFNSMVNISNLGPVTNITCNNNLFSNCSTLGSFVLCDGPDFGGGTATFSWTNNGYYLLAGKSFDHGIPGTSYTITANSGNYTAATATATSGVLINGGSGQI